MKKFILAIIILVIIAGGAYAYFFYGSTPVFLLELSEDQKEVRDLFGAPAQFRISYLPQGEEGSFVRTESWYYPDQQKEITFLAGEILSYEDYAPKADMPVTDLFPENFQAQMELQEVEEYLGVKAVEFDFPGFFDEDTKTYMSDKAIFTFNGDYLTYFETIGTIDVPEEQ